MYLLKYVINLVSNLQIKNNSYVEALLLLRFFVIIFVIAFENSTKY